MSKNRVEIKNITLVKQSSKRRMLRIISETDYPVENPKKLDIIFGMIDINLGQVQNAKIFNIITEGIGRYYKNSLEYDIAFDDMVNFLNRRASQFLPEKSLREGCDIIMGVLKDENLLFCANGEVYAYLIHPQGINKIFPEEKENTLDVSDKLFSFSLNGKLSKGCVLYFCNADFNATTNPYRLGKLIKEHNPKEIIANINDALLRQESARSAMSSRPNGQQYNALFLYNAFNKNTAEKASASIEKLFDNEQKITENLSPSILNIMRKSLKKGSILSYLLKYFIVFLKKFFYFLKFILSLLVNTFFILTNLRGKRQEKQVAVNSRFRNIWFKVTDFYRSLTAISKIILVGLVALVIFLSTAAGYSMHIQKIKQLKLSYQVKLQTAEELYNEADADLLFQEKNVAVKKLKNALSALWEVPAQIHDKEYNGLFNKIKERLYKIQNISEIASPVLIADFSLEENTNIYPPLFLENGAVNALSQSEIINIDSAGQTIKRNKFTIKGLERGPYYYDNDKKIIYSFENSKILQATNPDTLTSEIKEVVLHSDEEIKKFALYGEKMYALSEAPKHFSIWSHNPSLSGFGKPTLWATDNLPENTQALSLAIDGSLYVLFSDNQIFKFYRGNKAKWSYDAESIDKDVVYFKLLTNEGLKYIYLAGQKRISVLSKDGDFLAHFVLPSLSDIKDIVVDESARTIYVLNGEKIYAFSFQL
ncbi:hypothetical protein KJ885_00645 [Patescibacteria group bacterium]|nr:hypothetical protein [Patescibacteria group bacterium]